MPKRTYDIIGIEVQPLRQKRGLVRKITTNCPPQQVFVRCAAGGVVLIV
jgi:hypothetical protein